MGELFDFLAGCVIQIGNYFKIRHKARGWLLSMLGIAYWVGRAYYTGYQSQSFWHVMSFTMAAYGFWKWTRKE